MRSVALGVSDAQLAEQGDELGTLERTRVVVVVVEEERGGSVEG